MAERPIQVLADKAEMWAIEDLVPYARNAKRHPPDQVAQIAASIREFGFTIPILVAEDCTIIAGHGRLLAAQELGLAEVPVIVARGWTDEQRRAYTIADNRLTELGEWDEDLLKIELGELREEGFDVALTGFDTAALAKLLDAQGDDGAPKVSLAERFGVPPFSVLRAAEGWWQDRKRAWLALGITSELGRGEAAVANAEPGGSKMPAANYGKSRKRGDGRGRAVK